MHNENMISENIVLEVLTAVAKGGFLLTVGALIAKFFIFLRQFIVIRFLSPADYGLFSLGLTLVNLFVLIGGLGLQVGAQRYIAFYNEKDDMPHVRGTISSSMRILILSAAIVSLAMVFLSWPLSSLFKEPEFKVILLLLVPIVPLTIAIDMISAFYMGFKRTRIRTYVEYIGLTALSLICVLISLIFVKDIKAALIGLIISYVAMLVIALAYSYRRFPIKLRHMEKVRMGRELLAFSIPLLATFSLNYFMAQSDTLMLGYYTSASNLGFYNAAFIISVFVGILLYPVGGIFISVASGLVARESHIELKKAYRAITKWVFLFSAPIFIIIVSFPREVLSLAFGSEYQYATRALQVLCLGELFFCLTGPNTAAIIAYGRSRILMAIFAISTISNIILNIILIPKLGINGAAIASSIALACSNILCSGYLYYKYRVHPFSREYILPILALAAFSLTLYFPLKRLLEYSYWMLLAYYPLILLVALFVTYITGSIEPIDKAAIHATIAKYYKR